MGKNGGGSSTSLAPGFRFHPTDEELVSYYLKRKVSGKPFRFDAISDIDVYKTEPWDLPGLSKLKSRDLEWYFFSNLDKKYGNGSRTNRATIEGYWKTTGKDRPVQHRSRVVGMKKTLVYHRGRAPRGERSNWVMHEYKLVDEELEKNVVPQEAFVLCRIFHKSGSGPKNGEQYGAPFVEEEWEEDDNEVAILPSATAAEVIVTDESVLEENYLNQPLERSPPLLNFYQGDSSSFAETLAENESSSLTVVNEQQIGQETKDDHKLSNLPAHLEPEAVNNCYAAQPTNILSQAPINYIPGEQSLNNVYSAPLDEGFYLEANDLLEPIGEDSSDFQLLDEYLGYCDANNDIGQYLEFDSSDMLDVNDILNDQAFPTDQNLDQTSVQPSKLYQQLPVAYNVESASCSQQVMAKQEYKPDNDIGQYLSFDSSDFFDADNILNDQAFFPDQNLDQAYKQPYAFDQQLPEAYSASGASSSEQVMAVQNLNSDSSYSFMKQASQMLGNFPASPAFASELPTKDIAAKLHAVMHSSEPPVHVADGKTTRIRDVSVNDNAMNWSLDKRGNVNVVLSFNLPEGIVGPAGIQALTGLMSRKMTSRGWLYVLFFAVMVFCISAKVDTCIYAR
uniref:NAC transcription factor 1 n=1 Tax=Rheum palmatum TaxID=137221 RepID=A0AA49X954_RHEPA|nr:NAC transcription factor 1 [Rheum palmatum]